jgi:glycerol kinase
MKYILALDQGTSSCRALLFDKAGNQVALAQAEFTQHFPQTGWVEHDASEIWTSQLAVARDCIKDISSQEIAAIGITNQRETTVLWDKRTGLPIHRAIVWQDRRTAEFCAQLKQGPHAELITHKTGLVIDAYFSASKLAWLLDNVPEARSRAERGELAFGTIDSWLLWNLSGGTCHATDVSNAARTMLFNLHTLEWDAELLKIFNIPAALLPRVQPSSGQFASCRLFGPHAIPITGMAGDQHAATFGQACMQAGMAKNTYGTGCFMLLNTGEKRVSSQHQLLSTVAWQIQHSPVQYALEGSVFMAGAIVQWLRDGLKIIRHASEIEALAASVSDSGGVVLVPAFTGLGAPHWDGKARAALMGITRGTSDAHIAHAALQAIVLQVKDVVDAMQRDAAITLTELRVDGGATQNNLLMQMQADVLGVPVVRPRQTETTALGAAYLAGLAVDFWHSLDEIASQWRVERIFKPSLENATLLNKTHADLHTRWQAAIAATRQFSA